MSNHLKTTKQMGAAAAAKARNIAKKIVIAVMAVALLTGCGASKESQPAQTTEPQIQNETQWVSKYNLPQEMRSLEEEIDQEGIQGYEEILELAAHDFGELAAAYEFEDCIRIEPYADGYTKVYVYPELPQQLPFDNDWGYYVEFYDVNEEYIGSVSCDVNESVYSRNNNGIRMIKQTNDDVAVFYFAQDCFGHQEPAVMKVVDTSGEDEVVVMTLTRETAEAGEEEETTQPTEATEPAGPAVNTRVLDLAGCTLQEVSAALGDYSESYGFYWFDGGYVGYVYAYGTDKGNNYIQAPLDRLITDCPATLTVAELQQYFPGGYTDYDEMDGRDCFCWDYRGCTVVLFANYDGTYTSDCIFFYNCDALAQQSQQTNASVNEELFRILGKPKSQVDEILGFEGGYDFEYGCWADLYQDSFVSVYLDADGETCIGFNTPLKNAVNMSGDVDAAKLKQLFGSTYDDPWNGETSYRTMYQGSALHIIQEYGDQEGSFSGESTVNICMAGKEFFPGNGEQQWNNSNSLFYGGVTVYSQTATELVCSFEYYQLTPPNRTAETGKITLTSSDGITYYAEGVTDSWENELTVTVKMLEEAASVTWGHVKNGEYANFAFGDYFVYK